MLGRLIGGLFRRHNPGAQSSALDERATARLKFALALAGEGRHADAERIYRELLEHYPGHADLLHLAGNAALAQGRYAEAVQLLTNARESGSAGPEVNLHLGLAHAALGDVQRAANCYERAIAASADFVPALFNLGRLHQQAGRAAAAAEKYRRALEFARENVDLHIALAEVRRELGDHESALASAQRALELAPDSPDAWVQHGHALREAGRGVEAIADYRRAVALRPDLSHAHLHLGNALFLDAHDFAAATAEYQRMLELDAGSSEARFNLALMRIASGDYANGWPDYELRRLDPRWKRRPYEYPQWRGGELAGRRLLVYSEQGIGDEIMFASCVPDLIARGASCVIECLPKLEGLMRRSFPSAEVYTGNADLSVPARLHAAGIDAETPIGSLPLYFRRALADFPQHNGYLKADPVRVEQWRNRLAALGPGMKVGIAWQGGTQRSRRSARSLELARLAPVLKVPECRFVELQYMDCTDEIRAFEADTGVHIASWDLIRQDYDEAAALVCALDLVISVCTAVIHLGGALGRPVWVMVPYGCEWRYGESGSAMPWYPSVRLVRQDRIGEWGSVIETVADSLREKAQNA